jgi:hypothetical protein
MLTNIWFNFIELGSCSCLHSWLYLISLGLALQKTLCDLWYHWNDLRVDHLAKLGGPSQSCLFTEIWIWNESPSFAEYHLGQSVKRSLVRWEQNPNICKCSVTNTWGIRYKKANYISNQIHAPVSKCNNNDVLNVYTWAHSGKSNNRELVIVLHSGNTSMQH